MYLSATYVPLQVGGNDDGYEANKQRTRGITLNPTEFEIVKLLGRFPHEQVGLLTSTAVRIFGAANVGLDQLQVLTDFGEAWRSIKPARKRA